MRVTRTLPRWRSSSTGLRWFAAGVLLLALVASAAASLSSTGVLWGGPSTVIPGKGATYSSVWLTRGAVIAGDSYVYEPDGPKRTGISMSVQWPQRDMVWWPARLASLANTSALAVPMWLPLLGSLLITAWVWWPHLRRARLEQQQRCQRCGYSRHGLAGRACPECGTLQGSAP